MRNGVTIVNYGTIESTGTGFGAQAVDLLAGGTLTNYGTILGLGTDASGINAGFATDIIVNGATGATGALIEGWLNGIDQFSSAGTVVNFGTVEAPTATASTSRPAAPSPMARASQRRR